MCKEGIFLYFICIALLLSSCQSASEPDGYSKTKTGVYYKLLQFGENNKKAKPGDYITAHISYSTGNDSVFFNAVRTVKHTYPAYSGAIQECFSMLSEGDSASFFINADNFFAKTIKAPLPEFIPPAGYMKVNMKIISIRSLQQYKKDKEEFLSWIKDFGEYEKTVLRHYIENEQISVSPTRSGIYRIDITKGAGKHIEVKDTITVHYVGRFLNGKIFDSTRQRNEPFQFVFGTEWQVVKGLEEALSGMCEGDHALFIVPSELAFGKEGSSTGIIPSYTSVVFDVEVLRVRGPALPE
jgi:FKBP-type peptidyl-prolyl cis-trans isomerase FkpA